MVPSDSGLQDLSSLANTALGNGVLDVLCIATRLASRGTDVSAGSGLVLITWPVANIFLIRGDHTVRHFAHAVWRCGISPVRCVLLAVLCPGTGTGTAYVITVAVDVLVEWSSISMSVVRRLYSASGSAARFCALKAICTNWR